jgi:hypothetical protein
LREIREENFHREVRRSGRNFNREIREIREENFHREVREIREELQQGDQGDQRGEL